VEQRWESLPIWMIHSPIVSGIGRQVQVKIRRDRNKLTANLGNKERVFRNVGIRENDQASEDFESSEEF
jgi:uncharacterized protein Veg